MKHKYPKRVYLGTLTAALLFSSPAYANAGIPMIFPALWGMVYAILPVIAIEAYIIFQKLGVSVWSAIMPTSIANIASTLVGIPVVWFILLMLQLMTGGGQGLRSRSVTDKFLIIIRQPAWLVPYDEQWMRWTIPSSMLVLLVPFFFASWYIEYKVAGWILTGVSSESLLHAMYIANLTTYGVLMALVASDALYGYWTTREQDSEENQHYPEQSREPADKTIVDREAALEDIDEVAVAEIHSAYEQPSGKPVDPHRGNSIQSDEEDTDNIAA